MTRINNGWLLIGDRRVSLEGISEYSRTNPHTVEIRFAKKETEFIMFETGESSKEFLQSLDYHFVIQSGST